MNLSERLQTKKVPEHIIEQLILRCLDFLNSFLFNRLVYNKALCTATNGFLLKLNLSRLEEWVASELPSLIKKLPIEPIKQASNILVMGKSGREWLLKESAIPFASFSASLSSVFSSLSLPQILYLFASFQVDMNSVSSSDQKTIAGTQRDIDTLVSKFQKKYQSVSLLLDPDQLVSST